MNRRLTLCSLISIDMVSERAAWNLIGGTRLRPPAAAREVMPLNRFMAGDPQVETGMNQAVRWR
jgi:hypothetical protein